MIEIVPFGDIHVEDASVLFADTFIKLRNTVPELPGKYEKADKIMPVLKDLAKKFPGVAAIENGKLVGYLSGYLIPEFKGVTRGVVCPEYGHGAKGDDRQLIYMKMYTKIAETWVSNGYTNHAVMMPFWDTDIRNMWCMDGFGALCMDVVRSVKPIENINSKGITVRCAGEDDIDTIIYLVEKHMRYMAKAPVFLPLLAMESGEDFRCFLKEPLNQIWISFYEGKPVGYIRVEKQSDGAAHIVRDEGTIALTGAFVMEECRRKGIAAAMLQTVVDWALVNGFVRISVDFETANHLGRGFWLRYFKPVCCSYIRRVDERITWGHAKRDITFIY